MKIALFQPQKIPELESSLLRSVVFEPLGLGYLAAVLEKDVGCKVEIIHKDLTPEELCHRMRRDQIDVLGLSVYTYTVDDCIGMARRVKAACPGIRTVLGGYHATAMPESLRDKGVDCILTGPAENTFARLVREIDAGRSGPTDSIIVSEPADFPRLPWPKRSEVILKAAKIDSAMDPPPSQQTAVAQVSYSRGCPHTCSFCSSPMMFGTRVSWRDPSDVVQEIAMLQKEYGVNGVFFTDLTFNASQKKVQHLCRLLAERESTVAWYCMCDPSNLSEKTIRMMHAAGCRKIGWGIETTNARYREALKPGSPFDYGTVSTSMHLADELGIINRVYMLMGLPEQTQDEIEQDFQRLGELPADEIRIGFPIPFPGTAIRDMWAASITEVPFSEYTGATPVLRSSQMSTEQLAQSRKHLFRRFYEASSYRTRICQKIRRFPHLEGSFEEAETFRQRMCAINP